MRLRRGDFIGPSIPVPFRLLIEGQLICEFWPKKPQGFWSILRRRTQFRRFFKPASAAAVFAVSTAKAGFADGHGWNREGPIELMIAFCAGAAQTPKAACSQVQPQRRRDQSRSGDGLWPAYCDVPDQRFELDRRRCVYARSTSESLPDDPASILLILGDKHLADCFGFEGRKIKTPHLDQPVAQKTHMANAWH